MKCAIFVFLAVVTVALAEPPRYRFRSQKQEEAPAAEAAPYPPSQSKPYPPSGTKPSGPLFLLPERQQNAPPQFYGAPTTPAPAPTTTEASPKILPEIPTTTTTSRRGGQSSKLTASDDAETVDTKNSDAEESTDAQSAPQNVYYIYHPNGLLQRVVYTTGEDDKGETFTAQLRYENVEPIRGPIFTYDPSTFQLQPVDVTQYQQL